MGDEEELPDMRFGAGLLTKLEDQEAFVLPLRDAGAPSQPKRIDGQMGIKEEDESVEHAQSREGTEETVFVRETGGSTEIGVPETVRGTELEHNILRTYRNARRDENSPLPDADDVFYYDASLSVPDNMPTMEAEQGGYTTGYTWEISDDISLELMNDHEVSIDRNSLEQGEVSVYDLEFMETDEGILHFDRPIVMLEPGRDEIAVFRSGDLQYTGEVEGFREFLSEEYDWDMSDVRKAATVKVGARLDAYEETGDMTYEEFVNEQYMDALSDLGEEFYNFPHP